MDLETIARQLLDEGEVSHDVVGLGHSALEVVDIAIDRSVGYCSRLVLLRETVSSYFVCVALCWDLTFISYAHQHGHAYPLYNLEGGIACEESIPENHCILHTEFPSK